MMRNLIHAVRQLRASPGFAFTAILTLTLGIGAPATIFAVLDAVVLQPLPFPEPDRLVGVAPQPDPTASIPTMQDYLHRSTSFRHLTAYNQQWSPVQKADTRARSILLVSQDFFSTLGTRFALGQSWPLTGNEADCSSQAIVSGSFWNHLGGGNELGGRSLTLDGRTFPIVGVLSSSQPIEGAYALNHPEVFVQIGCDSQQKPNERGNEDYRVIGRLKPGVTIAQANADVARIDKTLQKDYPNIYSDQFRRPTLVFPYMQLVAGADTRPTLLLTLAACGLLLLIACANLANLMLARNGRRRTEFATRATLGASFHHLLQQLLIESSVLVTLGTIGGIALAIVLLNYIKQSTAIDLPRLGHASVRPSVLAFVVLLSAAVTFFLALLPGWRTLRPELLRDLQAGGRTSAGRSLKLAGRLLVLSQTTLTIVLVACAGWMIGDVYTLLHQPLGFAPDHLLMVRARYNQDHPAGEDAKRWEVTLKQIVADFRHLPGADEAAVADHVPLGHFANRYDFCSDAHPEQCRKEVTLNPNSYAISPGYFSTLRQPLLEGRDFTPADDGGNHVAIVNQALAVREWPGQSAIGHRVQTGEILNAKGKGLSWVTVVGVVGNVHTYDLQTTPSPDLYIPRAEDPSENVFLLLHAKGDPETLKNIVSARLKSTYPEARPGNPEAMTEEMEEEVSQRRFLMQVAMAFGGVALFLSILGVYGLLAYEVSLREKEIGIRLALGSSRERVVRLLLHEEGRWLVGGALMGVLCALLSGYFLRARFYAAQATTLPVLLCAVLLLLLPALLAIALPASRAALKDPAETLRRE